MACDNQRRQGLRQRLFPLFYHTVLKRIADRFFVPGQRSMDFLVGAGVPSSQIYRGLYSADMDRFSALAESRRTCVAWPKVFLFVGQYIDRKGVPDLLQAFAASSSSWSLVFCGSGPLKQTISTAHPGLKNVSDKGFIQPPDLPATMGQAGAFVMPSREDNWGLALLEAAAAGLPLICSSACGASEDVLREGLNGFAFPPGDVKALTRTLDGVAGADVAELKGMSGESICRASEYSAERWADRFWASVQSVFTGRTHQTVTSASAQIPGGCTK
jgi:glycosyltransferase involved in cell wall biosynthesis